VVGRAATQPALTLGVPHRWYANGNLVPLAHQISGTPTVSSTGVPLIWCVCGTDASISLFLLVHGGFYKLKSKEGIHRGCPRDLDVV
jgi:hypothetical protein